MPSTLSFSPGSIHWYNLSLEDDMALTAKQVQSFASMMQSRKPDTPETTKDKDFHNGYHTGAIMEWVGICESMWEQIDHMGHPQTVTKDQFFDLCGCDDTYREI